MGVRCAVLNVEGAAERPVRGVRAAGEEEGEQGWGLGATVGQRCWGPQVAREEGQSVF